jgi:site-specific recombinase XerD
MRTMARASELAAVRLEDVRWAGDAVSVTLRRSKTDHSGRGQEVFIDASGGDTCPVGILRRFLSWREAGSGLLFRSRTGAAMTTAAITALCRRAVAAAGCLERVSSHSLRIGGATAAVEGGMTVEQVMTIGGWRSNAVHRYIRARRTASVGASLRMGM